MPSQSQKGNAGPSHRQTPHRKKEVAAPSPQRDAAVPSSVPATIPLTMQGSGGSPLNPNNAIYLQRAIGNQAVARLLQTSSAERNSTRPQMVRRQPAQVEAASGAAGGQLSSTMQSDIQSARGSGRGLDSKTGAQMGRAFGKDFGTVKIHTDAKADLISRSLNANALTIGSDIFFRKNHYAPATSGGQQLLAHELTHVVQQGGASGSTTQPTVQTKLTVGASNDSYEQEADRVARQVTKQIWRPQTPVHPAKPDAPVQRMAENNAPVQVRLKTSNQGKIARSFAARANEFERSLGLYAFHHAKANNAARAMTNHIQKYIEKRAKEDGATEKKIDALWLKAGSSSGAIAGAVGDKIEDIKKVFAKGNLRERMTHIHNFMDHQMGNVTNKDVGDLFDIAGNSKEVEKQYNAFAQRTGQNDNIYYSDVMHKAAPQSTALGEQGKIRERTGGDSQTKLTVKDVGFTKEGGLLSKREARLMFGDFDNKDSLQDKQLQWSEGARVWKMRKQHEWVQTMESLELPLMAGPSAHTNAFLNIAKLFGIKDLASVRLAVIGQLLPINAHSLVEIMTAAAGHGLAFTPGPEMYRSIAPLKTNELRNQVGKGSFPDEFGSPETGSGGDYRKLIDKFNAFMKLMALPPSESDPHKQIAELNSLDDAAVKHIAAKQKEKGKLKKSKVAETQRLDNRIQAVEDMRKQIQSKLPQLQKAAKLHDSRKRISELSQNKEYDDKIFHGTHTGLLFGLEKSGGTLKSAKQLEDEGITRNTGEGDFFSNGVVRGPKEFISVGVGEFGLGTALAYAQAAGTLNNYNIEKYKDDELDQEVIRLQEAIDNYDESLIDLDKSEREYKSVAQLKNLLGRLQTEQKARKDLDKDHPRRKGELSDDSNFPLLFEFVDNKLDMRDEGGYAIREKQSMEERTYNTELMGERMIYGGKVDLKPLIRRVYCPLDKIDVVTKKLTTIFGHGNFEVLAIEALYEMPQNTPIGGVRHETYAMQLDFEEVRKNVISGYAQGMKTKQKVSDIRKLAKEYGTLPPPKENKDLQGSKQEAPQPKPSTENPPKPSSLESGKSKEPESGSVPKTPPLAQTPLEQALSNDGLRFHKIKGDGNCLFAAVLHQLRLQGTNYKAPMSLRRALGQHIQNSTPKYQQTVLAPIFSVEGLTVQQAAYRIQTPGYWSGLVGDAAPQLLANLLQRALILYRPDGSKQTLSPNVPSTASPLSIVYNGASHYDSTSPSDVNGPVVSNIPDPNDNPPPLKEGVEPKKLEEQTESSKSETKPLGEEPSKETGMSSAPIKGSSEGSGKEEGSKVGDDGSGKDTVSSSPSSSPPKPLQNLLKDDSPPVPKPKKGKPRVVLSGHGVLYEKTAPSKTKVPSNMSISFTGPMGSILDNPLANAVEENRLLPEDIFVEAVDMHTGNVTEIEPREIMKLYTIFGPRTVKGGKLTPNYTLTPPKGLGVSINNQVYTVDRDHTLAEIFPILRKIYPKGVDVQWAACQDLPDVDRRFQIKVMNVKDRFVPTANIKRGTTSSNERKETIKQISKMIKDFKTL